MVIQNLVPERQIAVLIDFENTGLNSIRSLFDQISDIGRIIVKKAYADWSRAGDKREELLNLGIEAVQLFRSGNSTKNSSDIRLVIDAIELMHQSPVDTFVIVSSDSDFAPLVSTLRASGKIVIGAGHKATASKALVISCDRYFYLDQSNKETTSLFTLETEIPNQVEDVLSRAIKAAIDEQGKIAGSKLHETMRRLDPSFDYRSLGYATFTKFIETIPWLEIQRPITGDTSILLIAEIPTSRDYTAKDNWETGTDNAWGSRAEKSGDKIAGPSAASDAAKILGVSKLSSSEYKTLQKLLDASELLKRKWKRKKNSIIRI